MTFGESYLVGKALIKDTTYSINIQVGKKGIVLPKDLIKASGEIIASFFTENKKEYILTANLEKGRDWIEIYDGFLFSSLAQDLPSSLIIDYAKKN
ncbi:MAG TPA: hypothetical protein VFP25_04145 [Nitrososphaeraceae archaeon]|nr:hypothetical protein [Nitrososphaeraceae archaeon]